MPNKRPSQKQSPSYDLLPLFEFSNVVNSSLDLKFILDTVLLTVMGKMLVSKGMVLLTREKHAYEIVNAKGVDAGLVGQTITLTQVLRKATVTDRLASANKPWVAFFKANGQKLIVPILAQGRVVGLLTLGERLGGKKYAEPDKQLIHSLVNLSGSAVEKALMIDELSEVNRDLDRKLQELNTLFDLGKEFNVVLQPEKVIRLLTFSLLGQIGVNRYAICLGEGKNMQIVASRLEQELASCDVLFSLQELTRAESVEELARKKKFAVVAALLRQSGIRVAVPMLVQRDVKGMILLGDRMRGGSYERADLEFLSSLANLAIISIENARLFRETLEKQRMEDELAIAREIQQGLLPRSLPSIPGFEVAAVNVPSKQVGGDYYDVLAISPTEYVFAIGDVSGKGTGAALLMANVQASLRAFAPMGLSMSEATSRINNLTSQNTGQGKFITFFWSTLDLRSGTMRYVNAGHNPPYLFRANGTLEKLDVGGIILGLMATVTPYEEISVPMQKGDVLVMYTDGVSEAMNSKEEDFTEERLEEILRTSRSLPAGEIIANVRTALELYTRDTPQSDDITMLVVKAL
ncbi:MAG: SpoIIE family protein phosphatase [Bacteroidota bacterium]